MTKYWADRRVRFVIFGAANSLLGWTLFAVIQFLLGEVITYFGSLVLTYVIGTVSSYYLQKKFVFQVEGYSWTEFLKYTTVYVPVLVANVILLPIVVLLFDLNVYFGQALFLVISSVITYVGHKFFSFRNN